MKKIGMIPLLLVNHSSFAQREKRWGDPHVMDKFTADTITSDFGEFHGESDNESFTIGGYVTPARPLT